MARKIRVNFSCHCLKFTIVFLSNHLNNGKKNSRELFLPLFKVYHCFFKQSIKQWQEKFRVNFSCYCLKFTIVFLSNQLNNGKKNSRELFLPLFKVYHYFFKQSIKQWQEKFA